MQEKLITTRRRYEYTQKDIAKRLGISLTQYGKKERGDVNFNSDEMFCISELFDESIEDLFTPRKNRRN